MHVQNHAGRVCQPGSARFSEDARFTADPGPTTGMRLGRYRLIEPLWRGCQGEVWRALQVEPIVEEVALKLLTTEQARKPELRSQFHREAMWGARLASPELLPTYEFGAQNGILFLAQPLVEGDTLGTVIARRRRWLRGGHPPRRHWLDRLSRDAFLRAIVTMTTGRLAQALAVRALRPCGPPRRQASEHLGGPRQSGACLSLRFRAGPRPRRPSAGAALRQHRHTALYGPGATPATAPRRDPLRRLRG